MVGGSFSLHFFVLGEQLVSRKHQLFVLLKHFFCLTKDASGRWTLCCFPWYLGAKGVCDLDLAHQMLVPGIEFSGMITQRNEEMIGTSEIQDRQPPE